MSELRLDGVGKRFGTTKALDGISLHVRSGSRTAIVGPSGSGKTTLLRLIAGFEVLDSGQITLGNSILADERAAVPVHRRNIGLVAQDGALFPHLSVGDNIGFGLPKRRGRADRVVELTRMVGLSPMLLTRRPDQLSGGQQQRVALARALACRPKLMLLDESFSSLDTDSRTETRKAVCALLSAAHITTVLVTHDQTEALAFADQVAVLHSGRLLQVGAPREVYLHPRTPEVAASLGASIILPARIDGEVAVCVLGRLPCEASPRFEANGRLTQVLIRPEQMKLEPVNQVCPSFSGDTLVAKVITAEFRGSMSNVLVKPISDDLPDMMVICRPDQEQSRPGEIVRVTVIGPVHTFHDLQE